MADYIGPVNYRPWWTSNYNAAAYLHEQQHKATTIWEVTQWLPDEGLTALFDLSRSPWVCKNTGTPSQRTFPSPTSWWNQTSWPSTRGGWSGTAVTCSRRRQCTSPHQSTLEISWQDALPLLPPRRLKGCSAETRRRQPGFSRRGPVWMTAHPVRIPGRALEAVQRDREDSCLWRLHLHGDPNVRRQGGGSG